MIGEKLPVLMEADRGAVNGVASLDSAGKVPREQLPDAFDNENLLDNWYFAGGGSQQGGMQFPINQRGQTEYASASAAYTIDRWQCSAGTTLSLQADGVKLSTNGIGWIGQKVENAANYIGKTLTFSALDNNRNLHSGSVVYDGTQIDIPTSFGSLRLQQDGDCLSASMWHIDPAACVFQAAKLELGSTQTLARQEGDGNWVLNGSPPDYTLELLRCQRCFFRCSTEYLAIANGYCSTTGTFASFLMKLPTQMRTNITNSNIDFENLYINDPSHTGAGSIKATGLLYAAIEGGSIVSFTLGCAGGLTAGAPAALQIRDNGYFSISCDL